jgi:hypothetical protein
VTESDTSDIRIGDTERESAVTALGEHMSAGRLDVEEYGDRTARVTIAKTRRELVALFDDLPAPRPVFDATPAPAAVPAQQPGPQVLAPAYPPMPVMYQIASILLPLVALGAIGLAFASHMWWLIFCFPGLFAWGGRYRYQRRARRGRLD